MTDPVTPLTPAQATQAEYNALHHTYLGNDAVALDDFVKALTDGSQDETISTRMAIWATQSTGFKKYIGTEACKALNIVSSDHGAKAELGDLARAQKEVEILQNTPTIKQEGL